MSEEIEFFDESSDVMASRAIVSAYRVKDGYVPTWYLELTSTADISELLAIGDALKLAQTQFDKLMDMVLSE